MNKLLAILAITALTGMAGCATKPFTGQTNYGACTINPNAVYAHEVTGEPTKCTDKLTLRRPTHF